MFSRHELRSQSLLRPTAGHGRPLIVGVGAYAGYFTEPSVRFRITSSKLKLAALLTLRVVPERR